jgi:hypothetical protein
VPVHIRREEVHLNVTEAGASFQNNEVLGSVRAGNAGRERFHRKRHPADGGDHPNKVGEEPMLSKAVLQFGLHAAAP